MGVEKGDAVKRVQRGENARRLEDMDDAGNAEDKEPDGGDRAEDEADARGAVALHEEQAQHDHEG